MQKQKKKPKPNPRNKPATMMDVKKAKVQATEQAIIFTKIITFQGLLDEGVLKPEDVKRGWDRVVKLSESINEGYVKYEDMCNAMIDEYGIDLAKI